MRITIIVLLVVGCLSGLAVAGNKLGTAEGRNAARIERIAKTNIASQAQVTKTQAQATGAAASAANSVAALRDQVKLLADQVAALSELVAKLAK